MGFDAAWPGLFTAPGRWPTRDGCIPWATFWLYVRTLPAREAGQRLLTAEATMLAIAATFGNTEGRSTATQALDRLRRVCAPGEAR